MFKLQVSVQFQDKQTQLKAACCASESDLVSLLCMCLCVCERRFSLYKVALLSTTLKISPQRGDNLQIVCSKRYILFQSADDADSSTISPQGVDTVGHSTVLPGETENISSSVHVVKRKENLTGFSTKLEHRAFVIEQHFPDCYPRGT